MPVIGDSLLQSLASAPWDVAARTFGSAHATLIGLVVHWWVSGSPGIRTALDGGPSYAGGRSGYCDALLCENERAVGLLEVEGRQFERVLDKIDSFFAAESWSELESLQFGMLLVYGFQLRGRGAARTVRPVAEWLDDLNVFERTSKISAKYPDKALVLVLLEREYEREHDRIRARREVYWGRLNSITGILYQGGQEVAPRRVYYERR